MKTFEVEVHTTVREFYIVDAGSRAEALENWFDGFLCMSEAIDSDVINIGECNYD